MISKQEILDRAQEWQLAPNIVEKDYVIGWLLWGLANYTPLKDVWIFKGGTCLKKCFIETYRFSEDLDFTVLPSGSVVADAVAKLMPGLLSVVSDASGINFAAQPPRFKDRPTFSSTEGRVYYQAAAGLARWGEVGHQRERNRRPAVRTATHLPLLH